MKISWIFDTKIDEKFKSANCELKNLQFAAKKLNFSAKKFKTKNFAAFPAGELKNLQSKM